MEFAIFFNMGGQAVMKNDLELFATKLKILRQKRRLTLEKLAELADLTPNHISKLEAAKSHPSFSSIGNLAKALDVEIRDLFNFDDLNDRKYIVNEFNKILRNATTAHLQLLYRIHKSLES